MTFQPTRMTLIQRIKNNFDETSWLDFTQTYTPYIMAILNRSGIPNNQVEDLCQDILIKVWKSISKFNYDPQRCTFRTWLSTVCRNTVCDFFKKKKRENISDGELPQIPDEAEINTIIEREWRLYIAGKAMEKISAQFNEKALKSYKLFQRGTSVEEISKVLNISESSVYVYNKRVKDAMTREIIFLSRDLS